MNNKKSTGNLSKNSKQVAQSSELKKERVNVKFTQETTAIVTIAERGAFKTRESNAGTKEQKRRMQASWCYLKVGPKDVVFANEEGTKILAPGEYQSPKGELGTWTPLKGHKAYRYYEGPKGYNPPSYHSCLRELHLNADAVQFYISEDSCPGRSKKDREEWSTLSSYERLVRNVHITAEGKQVLSITVVN